MSSRRKLAPYSEVRSVYNELKTDLWKFILSLVGEHDAAGDIMQDTVLRMIQLEREGRLRDDTDSVRGLFFRVAMNVYRDSYRKNRREDNFIEKFGKDFPGNTSDTPDQSALILKLFQSILNGDELTQQQKTIINMRLVMQKKVADIAETLDLSIHTVYRSLNKGLDIMRGIFEKRGVTPDQLT